MISETHIAYGSLLRRQGRSRRLTAYQDSNCERNSGQASGGCESPLPGLFAFRGAVPFRFPTPGRGFDARLFGLVSGISRARLPRYFRASGDGIRTLAGLYLFGNVSSERFPNVGALLGFSNGRLFLEEKGTLGLYFRDAVHCETAIVAFPSIKGESNSLPRPKFGRASPPARRLFGTTINGTFSQVPEARPVQIGADSCACMLFRFARCQQRLRTGSRAIDRVFQSRRLSAASSGFRRFQS